MTKISIIVPVYNVEKYLIRCLDTLVSQTIDDYEIILVNDGSKDNSLVICEDYYRQYPNLIKLFSKENGGLSDARNFGIDKAKGEYLAFIDSDDWVDKDMMSLMYDKAVYTNADIVVCDIEYQYEDGSTKYSSGGDFDTLDVLEDLSVMMINNSACNKIYRRLLFNERRFPKGLWYEDLATIPLIILTSKIIAKIDRPFYKYFQRNDSIMHTDNIKVFDIYKSIDILNEFINVNFVERIQDELKQYVEKLYVIHGLELTTLRIKEFSQNRVNYLQENMRLFRSRVTKGYQRKYFKEYPLKKRIVFWLLEHKQFDLLLFIYDHS